MRLVSVDNLTSDMTLAFPIYYKDALVINAGRANISKYIPNLINMGIQYVYIEDELSRGIEIPDAISEKTRYDCKNTLQKTMQDLIDSPDSKLYPLTNSIESVIDEVLENREIQVSLNDIGTLDEQTYIHSVNVSLYSLLIGRSLNYTRSKLQELAMGTILHDIGKTLIDPSIQFKNGKLNAKEYEQIKKHAEIGYYILSKIPDLSETARRIALNHHERMDGNGYPKNKIGDELHEYDCIAAIADVYDALTSNRCYKKKWSAINATKFLVENSGTMFSPELVQLFVKQIAVYPNGSMVLLSDNTIGIIKAQNRYVPLRPIVRVIYDENGNKIKPYEVDLMEILSITIIDSQLEIQA